MAQFSTVYTIPPDSLPPPIEFEDPPYVWLLHSDTQLNLMDGGRLPSWLTLGGHDRFWAASNIEANISGGRVASHFRATRGSTVNITGGYVESDYNAHANSVTNVFGGWLEEIDIYRDSEVNILGGFVEAMLLRKGTYVNISGGTFGDNIYSIDGTIRFRGSNFLVDGHPFEGLADGETVTVLNSRVVSGVLADGSPFSFDGFDSDGGEGSAIELIQVEVPPAEPMEFWASQDQVPSGIRAGQTLIVDNGSQLPRNFVAGAGSTVLIQPGSIVGENFEAVAANIVMSGGEATEMDAYGGSKVTISGGNVGGTFDITTGSQIDISGGSVEFMDAGLDTTINISGGAIDLIRGSPNLNVTGGEVDSARLSGQLVWSGGDVSKLTAHSGGVSYVGTEFAINGEAVPGLDGPGARVVVEERRVQLTGKLLDGSSLDIYLDTASNPDGAMRHHQFGFHATVTLVLGGENECDFDGDSVCRVDDLDALLAATGSDDLRFDLNADGTVTFDDATVWLTNAGNKNIGHPYFVGDATLDGTVDALDLNRIGRNWLGNSSKWSEGDFNGDGYIDPSDLNKLGIHWLANSATDNAPVPEPSTAWLMLLGMVACSLRKRTTCGN